MQPISDLIRKVQTLCTAASAFHLAPPSPNCHNHLMLRIRSFEDAAAIANALGPATDSLVAIVADVEIYLRRRGSGSTVTDVGIRIGDGRAIFFACEDLHREDLVGELSKVVDRLDALRVARAVYAAAGHASIVSAHSDLKRKSDSTFIACAPAVVAPSSVSPSSSS